ILQIREGKDRSCGAGKLSGEQLALFDAAIENRTRDRSSNHRSIELRFGVAGLPLRLHQRAFRTSDFLGPWTELRQLIALLERIHALLTRLILRSGVIQRLLRD